MNSHPSRRLLDTGLFRLGTFRAAPSDPLFHDSGPITRALFVFPRTSVVIQHEGGRPFVTDPNIVTFYNRGQRYRREAVEPAGDRCEWFAPHPSLLAEIVASCDPARGELPEAPFAFGHGPSDAASYLLQRLIFRHAVQAGSAHADRLMIDEAMTRVLQRVVERAYRAHHGPVSTIPVERHRDLVEQLKRVLALRLGENLSLSELAATLGCSPFHLCRVFRASEAGTIHRYRHQWRLRRALELLAAGDADITGVGLELGFSSHSHFTAAFHTAFSLVPSAFRRSASSRRIRELEAKAVDS